ncbi:hypothetical protein [Streptomyces caatingaensis]|uniref:Uncharacterized protein n=1 Tax=Streptomyces caatingaensis TaxID=1678637 RepID=A0A0K9X9S7_9ACTN|nr:hypothetical protein [Streptomyces caatingaensis]KNB50155.1 hypothetical protein AC230_26025 [Streptomyces caatingaensis]
MPDRNQWNAAAVRLFDDISSFVLTGSRKCDDWREDVLAVFAGEVEDPRGWIEFDSKREWSEHYGIAGDRYFPFRSLTVDYLKENLYPVEPESAAGLLVVMLDEWFSPEGVRNLAERKDSLVADARTLISRYGPDGAFYTSACIARTARCHDFLAPPPAGQTYGGASFSEFMYGDLGLVAVSDTEAGVFWAFNAGGDVNVRR